MASDALRERGKGLEEEYFHRKEKELIEKLRKRQQAEEERKKLAEATGNPDEAILKTLQELGYTRETVSLLHLVPLLNVAWADGHVSNQERNLILEAARLHGVAPDNPAHQQLLEWLNNRPSAEFFDQTLQIIGDLCGSTPPGDGKLDHQKLLDLSTRVAAAAGGILGLGKISDEERAVLDRLANTICRHADSDAQLENRTK